MGSPSSSTSRWRPQSSAAQPPRPPQWCLTKLRSNCGLGNVDHGVLKGISSGPWMPARATPASAARSWSVGQAQHEALGPDPQREERPPWSRGIRAASMGARRYTPPMGAVETMEDFFEKLNGGDREGAVALMDEMTEMRVHVGDSVQMLRGVERVGGWFLVAMRASDDPRRGPRHRQHLRGGPPGRPAGRPDPAHRRHVPRRGRQDHRDQHRAQVRSRPARPG